MEQSKPTKIQPNNSSELDFPLELDDIEKKIDNPQLRQPHETEEYLKVQKTLLLKEQKLEAEKAEAKKTS